MPTQVLELRGSFRKQKGRRLKRAGEPEPVGELGDPPPHLDEAERERWRELAEHAPWLSGSDRPLVEQTVRLWMMDRRGDASAAQQRLFAANLGRMGLTPADRSKVVVPGKAKAQPAANPFGELTG